MGKAHPDVFDDELAPEHKVHAVVYHVNVPGQFKYDYWANVSVEENDYASLDNWRWGEHRQPRSHVYSAENRHLMETEQEVWEWLKEWEFVELKAIGPEDSEYFATAKLTGKEE